MLLGKRVRLRRVERDDLPRFVAWLNDPEVREGLAMLYPVSLLHEEQWLEGVMKLEPAAQPFAIDALAEGQSPAASIHIGILGLHNLDWKNSHAELGIFIGDKAFWGRGYGTDALRTLLQFAFSELNLHRVWLKVYEYNARAIRSYEKAGLKHEGRLRHDRFHAGRYWDTLLMGMFRTELSV